MLNETIQDSLNLKAENHGAKKEAVGRQQLTNVFQANGIKEHDLGTTCHIRELVTPICT